MISFPKNTDNKLKDKLPITHNRIIWYKADSSNKVNEFR